MKKTLTVNLSGVQFNIDEDAYDILSDYLRDLEDHFKNTDEEEVLADIESRIAELFAEKMPKGHNVVNVALVNEVIGIMGKPDQIDGEEKTSSSGPSAQDFVKTAADTVKSRLSKKLYRSEKDQVVSGVCGGLAAWADVDSVALRAIVVLLMVLMQWWIVILYIVMWLIVPVATTPSQKLEMEGEEVNVETIRGFSDKESTEKAPRQRSGCLSVIAFALKAFVIFIGVVVGLGVLGVSLGLLGALIGAVFGIIAPMTVGAATAPFFGMHLALPFAVTSTSGIIFCLLSLFVIMCPIVAIILVACKLLGIGKGSNTLRNVGITVLVMWAISLFWLIGWGLSSGLHDYNLIIP